MNVRSLLSRILPSRTPATKTSWVNLNAQSATNGARWLGIAQHWGTPITIVRGGERIRCAINLVLKGDTVFDDDDGMPYVVCSIKRTRR